MSDPRWWQELTMPLTNTDVTPSFFAQSYSQRRYSVLDGFVVRNVQNQF